MRILIFGKKVEVLDQALLEISKTKLKADAATELVEAQNLLKSNAYDGLMIGLAVDPLDRSALKSFIDQEKLATKTFYVRGRAGFLAALRSLRTPVSA